MIVERVFPGDDSRVPAASVPIAIPAQSPQAVVTATASNLVLSPVVVEGTNLFLQLGAFSARENADIFRARMARELDWNREPLHVSFVNGLWRVRLGPYSNRIEAEAIAEQVKASRDFSPVISTP